jgi:hypothetical protein
MGRIASFFIIAALGLSAAPLAAQGMHTETAPEQGLRVRVTAAGAAEPLTGTLAFQDATTIALLRAPGDTALVPLHAVERLEVSRGRRSNAGRGLRRGALIGAAVGAVLGVALMADDGGYFDYGAEAIPLGAAGGAMYGSVIGLVVGALSRSEQWAEVPARPAIVLGPTGGGVAAGIRLDF